MTTLVFGSLSWTWLVFLGWVVAAVFCAVMVSLVWVKITHEPGSPLLPSISKSSTICGGIAALPVLFIGYQMTFVCFHKVELKDSEMVLRYEFPPRSATVSYSEITRIEAFRASGKGDSRRHAVIKTEDKSAYFSLPSSPTHVEELEKRWKEKRRESSTN